MIWRTASSSRGVAPNCVGKVDLVASLKPWMEEEGISHVPVIYNNSNISPAWPPGKP